MIILSPDRLLTRFPAACKYFRSDVRNRRNLLVAAGSGEGPLTEPTAAAQLWEREPLLMPRSCPPGGSETRAVCFRQKIMVSPFNDHRRGDLVRF